MGDEISLQYGGSIAHHASLSKKKGFFKSAIPELWTSVKRHWANNFSDSSKQVAINLFLGMYIPLENTIPLWNLENDIILHQ
jgi:phosphatidylinositol 3,5-bisphosphate 5-phosphatase